MSKSGKVSLTALGWIVLVLVAALVSIPFWVPYILARTYAGGP